MIPTGVILEPVHPHLDYEASISLNESVQITNNLFVGEFRLTWLFLYLLRVEYSARASTIQSASTTLEVVSTNGFPLDSQL